MPEMIRHGAPAGWAIAATLANGDDAFDVGTGLVGEPMDTPGGEPELRRTVRVDGTNAAPADLARLIDVTWLTPQMDRLFAEGASGRRRFLDRLVLNFDPEHARRASAYERLLRERNRLLKEHARDRAWMDSLEARMADEGVAIAAARREAVTALRSILRDAGTCDGFPTPEIALEGTVETWLGDTPAVAVEDRFREELARGRPLDAQSGRTASGPHRTDLDVRHGEKDMPARLCSTGEQKALLISLVLASARLGAHRKSCPPVLLLDEVAAHLDAARRSALFGEIRRLGAQAWLTGTDAGLFEEMRDLAQFVEIRDGDIAAA
jgi:DNA replication and repair protein RecF